MRRRLNRRPITIGRADGVSLIEVLIAVLVLSVGLLGLGALQGVALQSGQLSYQRTQATNLAYRVADEFRAHRSLTQPPQAIRNHWDDEMATLLPNGTLEFSRNGDELEITITWRDDRDETLGVEGNDRIVFTTRI